MGEIGTEELVFLWLFTIGCIIAMSSLHASWGYYIIPILTGLLALTESGQHLYEYSKKASVGAKKE